MRSAAVGFIIGVWLAARVGLAVWSGASYPTALAVETVSGIAVAVLAALVARL